ncbi:hypothetical protein HYX13_04965 [Candidatus Woesearchaeota archaeon]|nr:hypothetical protein [Candidatus Woesearchaeota archaeon]
MKTPLKKSLPSFFIVFTIFLLLLTILLFGCERELVPDVPSKKASEGPFAQASDSEILQQYPDDLDEALEELEMIEE